jgi:CheY-like chemotaxis protein
VRHLTRAHGGEVSANSPGDGQGATFLVRLPLYGVSRRKHAEPTQIPGPDVGRLAGARVLVVDDDPEARGIVRMTLEACGAKVTTVKSAGEALHALGSRRYDVLLADIGMPEQDGYALIEAIRALPPERGGTIPAVAVTAYASLRERDKALDAGYNWHLAKPFEPDQLTAMVASAVGTAAREINISTTAAESSTDL